MAMNQVSEEALAAHPQVPVHEDPQELEERNKFLAEAKEKAAAV